MTFSATKPLWSKKIRVAILVGLAILALVFFYAVRAVLVPFVLAVALAYILDPVVLALETRGIKRIPALLFLYFVLALVLGLLGTFGVPLFYQEARELLEELPRHLSHFEEIAQRYFQEWRRMPLPPEVRQVLESTMVKGQLLVRNGLQSLAGGLMFVVAQTFNLILTPVLTYYILKDKGKFTRGVLNLFPPGWRQEVAELWGETDHVIRSFIRGHLMVSAVVGVMTMVGLAIVGMPYAVILGFLTGVAEIVPYVGPLLIAVPIIALAAMESYRLMVSTIVVLLVVEQVEANLLSPRVMAGSIGLHPLLVFFAFLAGGKLFGFLGLLTGVPLMAIFLLIWRRVWVKLVG